MKITGQDPAKTAELSLGKAKGKEQQQPASARERESQEAARTRPRSSLTLTRVKEAIRNEPEVRARRVAELKEKIHSGEYRVDAERVADRMLIEALREDIEQP